MARYFECVAVVTFDIIQQQACDEDWSAPAFDTGAGDELELDWSESEEGSGSDEDNIGQRPQVPTLPAKQEAEPSNVAEAVGKRPGNALALERSCFEGYRTYKVGSVFLKGHAPKRPVLSKHALLLRKHKIHLFKRNSITAEL